MSQQTAITTSSSMDGGGARSSVGLIGLSAFSVCVAVLSAQRFFAPPISAFACVLPLALALANWSRPAVRNSMISLALLAKVDSSDVAYVDTPGVIRLLINFGAIAIVLAGFRASVRRVMVFGAYVLVLLAITLSSRLNIDYYSLARDVITLVLLFGVIGTSTDEKSELVSVESLTWFSFGLLGAELVNLVFFFESGSEHYLSYDSLKCIVIFASLVALVRGRLVLFAAIAMGTLVVLIGYATRMLLLTYVFILLLLVAGPATARRAKVGIVTFLVGGLVIATVYLSQETVDSSRMFSFIYVVPQAGDLLEYVKLLDPVRYIEQLVFFDRPVWRIAIGDGLGSGIVDKSGIFSFVLPGTGAYSDIELLQGRYFRLHDFWIYFGLRLGLVFVVVAFGFFVKAMFSRNRDRVLLGALGLLCLTNATFAISGLIMTGLIAKCIACTSAEKSPKETAT